MFRIRVIAEIQSIQHMKKFFRDLIISFLGVMIALATTYLYDRYKKEESYRAMGRSIFSEASANETILAGSFIDQLGKRICEKDADGNMVFDSLALDPKKKFVI